MNSAERESGLSTGEVSRLLSVSADVVRWWAKTGRLACTRKPNGRWMFLLADVQAFAAKRQRRG